MRQTCCASCGQHVWFMYFCMCDSTFICVDSCVFTYTKYTVRVKRVLRDALKRSFLWFCLHEVHEMGKTRTSCQVVVPYFVSSRRSCFMKQTCAWFLLSACVIYVHSCSFTCTKYMERVKRVLRDALKRSFLWFCLHEVHEMCKTRTSCQVVVPYFVSSRRAILRVESSCHTSCRPACGVTVHLSA